MPKEGLPKKGQITAFALLGLFIAVSITAAIYLNYDIIKDKLSIGKEKPKDFMTATDSARAIVERCMEETAEEGIFYLGLQGGYYETRSPFEQLLDIQTPYYFYLGNESIPTKEEIQKELSKYIEDHLEGCIDFSALESRGYYLETGEATVETTIKPGQIDINAEYPVTITQESITNTIKSFSQKLSLDFNEMHNIILKLAKEQKKNPSQMPVIPLSNLAYDNGFKYVTTDLGDNKVLFTLLFNNSLKEDYYVYAFTARYPQEGISIPEEAELPLRHEAYRTKLFAPPSTDIESEFSTMSDTEFGELVKKDPTQLINSEVFEEFNRRIKAGGETGIISVLNNNQEVKDKWFEKFLMKCDGCKLVSYDGEKAITAAEKVSFNPRETPGSTVLSNGAIVLRSGINVSKGAEIKIVEDTIAIKNGAVNFIPVKGFKDLKIVNSEALIEENEEQEYKLKATSSNPFTVSFDMNFMTPAISGTDVLISKIKSDNSEEKFIKFSGKLRVAKRGTEYTLEKHADLTDYNNDKPSIEYRLIRETDYYPQEGLCAVKHPRSCIIRSGNQLKAISNDNHQIQIKILDNSITDFKHVAIRDRSSIILDDGLVGLKFTKKDQPEITKGDPMSSNIKLRRIFNEIVALDYRPTKGGYALDILVNENPVGAVMSRELATMNSMQRSLGEQDKLAEDIKRQFGGQAPHKIIAYFNSPEELPLIQAVNNAQDKTKLDANFISAVSFGEGLINWADNKYYDNPNREVSSSGELGADRFGKEVSTYRQVAKASDIKLQGKKLTAEITEIMEPGIDPQKIKPIKIEIDADKIKEVNGKKILELNGNTIEIEKDQLILTNQGLIEQGYLREDFNKDEEFKTYAFISTEKGEMNREIEFKNIEYGLEGLGAMLKMRRDLFLKDVQKSGFNPKKLSEDQIDYWTYIYYNGGSGAPEDLFGSGRKIVQSRLSKYGLKGLEIPSEKTSNELYSNAQRILGTKKLLDQANPSLAKTAKFSLN